MRATIGRNIVAHTTKELVENFVTIFFEVAVQTRNITLRPTRRDS
jgi:hypothetical protein